MSNGGSGNGAKAQPETEGGEPIGCPILPKHRPEECNVIIAALNEHRREMRAELRALGKDVATLMEAVELLAARSATKVPKLAARRKARG